MSSFEELMKMAEENSRHHHKKIAETKRLREREEALRLKEKEKALEQQNRQKKHLSQIPARERMIAQAIPRRPLPIPNKPTNNTRPAPTSDRSPNSNPMRKRAPPRDPDFASDVRNPKTSSGRVEAKRLNDDSRPMKSNKSAAFLSFDELKKVASGSSDFSKTPAPQSRNAPQSTLKKSSPAITHNKLSSRNPHHNEPSTSKIPSNGQSYPRPNVPLKKKPLPPNQMASQNTVPRRALSPPRNNKRLNPEPIKKPNSTLNLGTRFSKYGPLDNDLPAPRSNNTTSNPARPRAPQGNPVRSSNPSENSRPNPSMQRSKMMSNQTSMPNYREPQPVKRMVRPEVNDRPRAVDPRKSQMSNMNRVPARANNLKPPVSRVSSQRPPENAKKRRVDFRDDVIDEEYAKNNISSIIGSIFGYDRSKYRDDFSDDEMEVSASRVRAEELRSARLGREEDEIEEALERERLERIRQRKRQR